MPIETATIFPGLNRKEKGAQTPLFTRLLVLLCLGWPAFTTRLPGQAPGTVGGNEQWLQYYFQAKLNRRWTWLADGGYRWKNGFQESSQYILRTGIGYALNPNLSLSVGLAHLGFFATGAINKIEFRPYQELLMTGKWTNTAISHRYRVEERFFYPVLDGRIQYPNTFNFRFRYALTVSIPLARLSKTDPDKQLLLNLGDEIFINAGKNIVYNVFDQNRLVVGPVFQFSKNLSISPVFNFQYASTTTPATSKYTTVFWLQVRQKLMRKESTIEQ